MSPMLVLWTGLIAGTTHVTSVDHLAALLPLPVGRRPRAFALGARCGGGHRAGVLTVAALAVALRARLDLGTAAGFLERSVALARSALPLFGFEAPA